MPAVVPTASSAAGVIARFLKARGVDRLFALVLQELDEAVAPVSGPEPPSPVLLSSFNRRSRRNQT